jgi:hypothetical protein
VDGVDAVLNVRGVLQLRGAVMPEAGSYTRESVDTVDTGILAGALALRRAPSLMGVLDAIFIDSSLAFVVKYI